MSAERVFHHTNCGRNAKPSLWGFEGSDLLCLVVVLAVSLLVFQGLVSAGFPPWTAGIGAACLLVSGGFLLVRFKRNRPPSFARDAFDSHLIKGSTVLADSGLTYAQSFFPSSAISPTIFPQAHFLSRNCLLFSGPWKHGYVALGFRLSMPGLEHASQERLLQLEQCLRPVLAAVSSSARIQFQWRLDSGFKEALRAYHEATQKQSESGSEWRTNYRSERFLRYWEAMEQGRLNQEVLEIYVTTRIEEPPRQKVFGGVLKHYELIVESETRKVSPVGQNLQRLATEMGGTLAPINQRELFETCFRKFNPSVTTVPELDEGRSLEESCCISQAAPRYRPDAGFYLDGHYFGALILKTLPHTTYSGLSRELAGALPFSNYTLTVNVEPLDVMGEIRREERQIEKLQRSIEGRSGSATISARTTIAGKEERVVRLSGNTLLPFRAQWIFVTWAAAPDALAQQVAAIKNQVARISGAQLSEPAFPTAARNLFLATVPGWSWSSYRDFFLELEDAPLANLLPIGGSPGMTAQPPPQAIYDGCRNNLVSIDCFRNSQPKHLIVRGKTGSGKSVFMMDLLSQVGGQFDYTVLIDSGLSYFGFIKAVDPRNEPLVVGADSRLCFNYLDTRGLPLTPSHLTSVCLLLKTILGDDYAASVSQSVDHLYTDHFTDWMADHQERLPELVALASAMEAHLQSHSRDSPTDAFCRLQGEPLPPIDESRIPLTMADPAHSDLVKAVAFAFMKPEEMPLHSDLVSLIETESLSATGRDATAIVDRLREWCERGGNHGGFLDGTNNVDLSGKLVHIEIGDMPEGDLLRDVVAFLITHYIRSEIMKRPRSQRKCVVLEELSTFLNVPGARTLVREFFETSRKYNAWLCGIVQTWGSLANIPEGGSIIGNASQFLFLKQTDKRELDRIENSLDLPEITRDTLQNLPDPSPQTGAGFVHFQDDGDRRSIQTGFNCVSREMLEIASSMPARTDSS